MPTKSLIDLDELLLEAISDFISTSTTTNITTDNFIFSTELNNISNMARDDAYNNMWVYLNTTNNPNVDRKVRDYTTATGRLEIWGNPLSAETGAVTIRLSRYSREDRDNAIKRAIEEIYPTLHLKLESRELITGNILPPFNWTSPTALAKYKATNANLAKTTSGEFVRRGDTSAKVTAGGANGYLSLHSDDYPRLKDLMDKAVSLKCWALPEVANDAKIEIRTKQADGTAQTLTSTTANPAGEFSLLELEGQQLNDDLVEVELRFYVATNAKYVYYDPPRLTGISLYEYILPKDFQEGDVSQIDIQISGDCDTLHPQHWQPVYGKRLISDGVDIWIKSPYFYTNGRQIRLTGRKKLESLSADTDTITLDKKERVNVLIAYSAYKLFTMVRGLPATADISRFEDLARYWLGEFYRLSAQHKMNTGAIRMSLPAV